MSTMHNLTADGSTPASIVQFTRTVDIVVVATGSFGGGTLTIEQSVDGVAWGATALTFIDAAGAGSFKTASPLQHRATLAGATAPNVNVTFIGG